MIDTSSHPFPLQEPSIHIRQETETPFAVDCPELRWWFAVPYLGEPGTLWGLYDSPHWGLSSVTRMRPERACSIHDIPGIEIRVDEWEPTRGWRQDVWTMYTRLTDKHVGWLAVARQSDDGWHLRSFLDNGFETDWGESPRRIEDRGRYELVEEHVYRQTSDQAEALGCGLYTVTIGPRSFRCLRVLDPGREVSERGILVETFVTQEGRTVLFRRYNGRSWGQESAWDEKLPGNRRLVIDGVKYVHWYDCLTQLAVQ
jgi:hypothetical protein